MKTRFFYFYWVIALSLSLMLLIYLVQIFTDTNIAQQKKGNQEAAITFTVRNKLQEIVNIVYAIETNFITDNIKKENIDGIKDSLTIIGYNASVLERLSFDSSISHLFHKLNTELNKQISISLYLLDETNNKKSTEFLSKKDSLIRLKTGEKVFNIAYQISNKLENKLQDTLIENSEKSRSLSLYSKALALIAIAAILILGTIIINRHLRQLKLIYDLEKANKEVEKSAKIKEQFLSNMSHEIRTPLNAINGFSGLLSKTNLDIQQKQFTEIIENASNNLLEIVNDILDISKIESGNLQIKVKDINLRDSLKVIKSMFAKEVVEKNLIFDIQINEKVPHNLKGDLDRLNQILINLISNAIKFTQKGFVRVKVSELYTNNNKSWIQFIVEDSGVGIQESKINKIFERFYQIDKNEVKDKKGTGLGLSIVQNLVSLLSGEIEVESIHEKGSRFTILLPFDKVDSEFEQPHDIDSKLSNKPQFPEAKVLVGEDNSINRILIKYMLKLYGIEPVCKVNGLEVLNELKAETFDLVLLDIQMPIMDGLEVLENTKVLNLQLPIVAMTAYSMKGEKENFLALGMSGYLSKPILESELQFILEKYLVNENNGKRTIRNQKMFDYLLDLSGGNEEIVNNILGAVEKQLILDIDILKDLLPTENNKEKYKSYCHNLISTVSPLGSDTMVMNKIIELQSNLNTEMSEENIQKEAKLLFEELLDFQADLYLILNK